MNLKLLLLSQMLAVICFVHLTAAYSEDDVTTPPPPPETTIQPEAQATAVPDAGLQVVDEGQAIDRGAVAVPETTIPPTESTTVPTPAPTTTTTTTTAAPKAPKSHEHPPNPFEHFYARYPGYSQYPGYPGYLAYPGIPSTFRSYPLPSANQPQFPGFGPDSDEKSDESVKSDSDEKPPQPTGLPTSMFPGYFPYNVAPYPTPTFRSSFGEPSKADPNSDEKSDESVKSDTDEKTPQSAEHPASTNSAYSPYDTRLFPDDVYSPHFPRQGPFYGSRGPPGPRYPYPSLPRQYVLLG